MKRRDMLAVLSASMAWPLAARPQAPRLPVIGYLHPAFPPPASLPTYDSLRAGLREHGLHEGKTVILETRWAKGDPDALAGLAAELVRAKVDVLIAVGSPAVMAARRVALDTPIVCIDLETDPVASGLVKSLSHP